MPSNPSNPNKYRFRGPTSFSAKHEAEVARRAVMEEREAETQKQLRFAQTLEKIKTHRARGMSDSGLIRIYGAEAVRMEEESRRAANGTAAAKSGEALVEALKSSPSPSVIKASAPGKNLSALQSRLPQRRSGG